MAVAADPAGLEIRPTLEEARELARDHTVVPLRHTFIADCETPVSAYLRLRGAGPSFLLESAEQGQRVGRWSFLGFRPRVENFMSFAFHLPDALRDPDDVLLDGRRQVGEGRLGARDHEHVGKIRDAHAHDGR